MLIAKAERSVLLACLIAVWATGNLQGDVTLERIGVWGGEVRTLAVQGDLACVPSGDRMLVVDVSDPDQPVQVGSLFLGRRVQAVDVQGRLAYAVTRCGQYELAVIDLSEPRSPRIVGEYNNVVCAGFISLVADGDLLHVGYSGGVKVLDISDPTNPRRIGESSGCVVPGCWEDVNDMVLSDSLLYVADSRYFRILDVSDPTNPVALSSVEVDFAGRGGVAVEGDRAYVAAEEALFVFDVTDPRNPRQVGEYPMNHAMDVEVSNGLAYVANLWNGLVVLDVSGKNPLPVAHLNTHAAVMRVTRAGDRLYLADLGEGMIVVDISEPRNPVRRGRLFSPARVNRTTLDGDLLYVADHNNGISILDVSNPREPRLVGTYQSGLETFDVQVRGSLAYVAGGTNGFEILDVSDPTQPVRIGQLVMGGYASSVKVRGDLAFVGHRSPSPVGIVDISDPRRAWLVGVIVREEIFDIELAGDFAFVSGNSLKVADISDPSQPVICASLRGADTFVRDDLLYVAAGWFDVPGLRIFDISAPCAPLRVGTYQAPGSTSTGFTYVTVRGRRAYMIGPAAGLHIADVADPSAPTFLTQTELQGTGRGLTVDEPYLYVSESWAGVGVYQVSLDGDLDDDDDVDLSDLGILLSDFGCTAGPGACPGDVDDDGDTDLVDLEILLDNFGKAAR